LRESEVIGKAKTEFPDHTIPQELPDSLCAHINKLWDIPTGVTELDSQDYHTTLNFYRDNNLRMTVPLVPDTNGTVTFFSLLAHNVTTRTADFIA
jgi:hypothetical protein